MRERRFAVRTDDSRDSLLTDFSKVTLSDRYLQNGESFQDRFASVACAYASDQEHAQRLYDYISQHWFMPATPILSNGGTDRGLPISCFLNEVRDTLTSIDSTFSENFWLAAKGGGIGTYWGNIRSIGEPTKNGKTSGVIPFVRVQDSLTLAISQGSLRRGSSAAYLHISHPEIEEFVEVRRPTGGDPNRKCLNVHHGVVVTDAFMESVRDDKPWNLVSPKNGQIIRSVSARDLWIRILTARMEQGEPYLIFSDTVNRSMPAYQKDAGLSVTTSNLCAEITLPTGIDQYGEERTAVCCLSSLNLETWDQWKDNSLFIKDVMLFLDNVLQDFIDKAPDSMSHARYAAMRERSVGLGVMGFHSFLQSKSIPFESAMAKSWNLRFFKHIFHQTKEASIAIAEERGSNPDAADKGVMDRFACKTAIAPTASISIIAGTTSPGIDPITNNAYTQKTLSGSHTVCNRHLKTVLARYGADTDDVWDNIAVNLGSVQHLPFLSEDEKAVFRTAFEIDQRWVVEHAADRASYVSQSQSVNLFLPPTVHKRDLHMVHFTAWQKGLKSLYYCRSHAHNRAGTHATDVGSRDNAPPTVAPKDYDECLACQ